MAFVAVARAEEIPVGHGTFIERDGPLSEGWIEGSAVVCPWHGFDFDLATGRCHVDEDLAVPVYAVRVTSGVVEVDLP